MEDIKQINYKNATYFKYKNTRVLVGTFDNDEFVIEMKILSTKEDADKPRAIHKKVGDKIVVTGFKVTLEGAIALMNGLEQELKKHCLKQS